jgi:hypothetical protein
VADEYVVVTAVSGPGEPEAAFRGRMTAFWTHMVRTRPDDYERVYAEATRFQTRGDVLSREYMVEADAAAGLAAAMTAQGITSDPFDPDDTYSKYEATPPDWFWLEH